MPFQHLIARQARTHHPKTSAQMRFESNKCAIRLACIGARDTGALIIGHRQFPCVIGRSGRVARKREGDGGTPFGRHSFSYLLTRPDKKCSRHVPHGFGSTPTNIRADDGWCDDPGSQAYNKPIPHPNSIGHEKMWRLDHLYDLVVPLNFNDGPVLKGRGSAIFFHICHQDRRPTEGCIAVSMPDMLKILASCGAKPVILV